MKIQYCSDLHMEFHENMRFMKSLPLEPVGDVLVIAGDVGYLVDSTVPHLRFWKWASENYRQVLMIAGKIQCDLSFLQLRLLHAEKIGVLGQQKFGKSLAHTGS